MSQSFQSVMNDVSTSLKGVYNAQTVIVVPGGGTYAMEAVARQFATNQNCLVLRNGWFSFRWSQIFEMGSIPSEETVMKARRVSKGSQAPFAPAEINEVVDMIKTKKPNLVLHLTLKQHLALFCRKTISVLLPTLFTQLVACLYWIVLLQVLSGLTWKIAV